MVAKPTPLKSTVEEALKLVPSTVRVKLFPPAVTEVGEILVVVRDRIFPVNVCALVVPPPGAGFTTVIKSDPPTVISDAGTVTVMVVLETEMIVSGTPLKSTVEEALKLVPLTVSVKDDPPAVVEVGLIDDKVGTGLLTVSVCAFEVPPPGAGFTTVIKSDPPTVISDAGTVTVMVVLETEMIVSGTPLKSTVEEALKLVPLTVSVKDDPPAVVEVGLIDDKVGTGLLTVSVCAFEVPPPGAGFTTVMKSVPPTAISVAGTVMVS